MIGGVVLVAVLAIGGDDDGGGGGPDTTTTTLPPVSDTGQELLDRLAMGRDLELHLVFAQDPSAPDEEAVGSLSLELWRSEGRVRQDLSLRAGAVQSDVAAFELPDGTFFCQRSAETEWSCNETRSTATENDAPAGYIEAAAAEVAGREVTTSEETILEMPARCYAFDGEAGPNTICVTEEGIPVRLSTGGQQLTLTSIEREVDILVYNLPAEVTAPTSPTTTVSDPETETES